MIRSWAAGPGCLSQEYGLAAATWVGLRDFESSRFALALPLLDRALALAPTDRALLASRAIALATLGRGNEAREVWSQIVVLEPGTELGKRAAEKAAAR